MCARCVQMHVDRVWHKYASRAVPRLRSVTNRVLIMNENNTRASISKHTFLGVKPFGSTTLAAEACGKISCMRTNVTPIITGIICMLTCSSLNRTDVTNHSNNSSSVRFLLIKNEWNLIRIVFNTSIFQIKCQSSKKDNKVYTREFLNLNQWIVTNYPVVLFTDNQWSSKLKKEEIWAYITKILIFAR